MVSVTAGHRSFEVLHHDAGFCDVIAWLCNSQFMVIRSQCLGVPPFVEGSRTTNRSKETSKTISQSSNHHADPLYKQYHSL